MSLLESRLTEISYVMGTVLVLFAGDYVTDSLVIRRIRKRNIAVRTALFLAYVTLVLPAVTVGSAQMLQALVLEPYKRHLWVILAGFFLLSGVLLSVKYRMKLF